MRQTYRLVTIEKCNTTGNQLISIVAAVCLLLSATTSALAQTEFEGTLRGVSISDAAGTNTPPTAIFTYSQDGDTLIFDASGSSDSDGSITEYKWDFSDGTTSKGTTATYTLIDAANMQVTLTLIDNNNGVAISQQTITPTTKGIADNFSIDTAGDYTIFSGDLQVYDGVAHASGAWTTTFAIHSKELASSDHGVEADVYSDGATATGGLMFRVNKLQNTGYIASFLGGKVILSAYNAGKKSWLSQFDGKFTAGLHRLRAEISGNIIRIYVEGNLVLQTTNNTYTTGNSVGLYIEPYGKNTLITVDNLTGE